MAAKRFHVSTPNQLRELAQYATGGSLVSVATVWSAEKRRVKQAEVPWDTAIYVGFSGDRNRIAEVIRINDGHEAKLCGRLRYNLALRWCERNLRAVA